MKTINETGHHKNVSAMESLISFCTAYGSQYNPSKVSLELANLQTRTNEVKTNLQNVAMAKTAYDNATNAREVLFKPLRKLCTRIINALSVSGATEQTLADAKSVNNKLQGKRAKKKDAVNRSTALSAEDENSSLPKTISVSRQSFDSLLDNFEKLVFILSLETAYQPNEEDLQLTTLNALVESLKTSNLEVINTKTAYSNARLERDKVMYEMGAGLVDLAHEVKKYVKSLFGATSAEYKQVSGLRFRALRL